MSVGLPKELDIFGDIASQLVMKHDLLHEGVEFTLTFRPTCAGFV
jgi:hypothetical protein